MAWVGFDGLMGPDSGECALADSAITEGRILQGIKLIKDHLACSLHEALDVFIARYDVLRHERPSESTTP